MAIKSAKIEVKFAKPEHSKTFKSEAIVIKVKTLVKAVIKTIETAKVAYSLTKAFVILHFVMQHSKFLIMAIAFGFFTFILF